MRKEILYTKEVKWLLDTLKESICLLEEKMNTSELDEPPGMERTTET